MADEPLTYVRVPLTEALADIRKAIGAIDAKLDLKANVTDLVELSRRVESLERAEIESHTRLIASERRSRWLPGFGYPVVGMVGAMLPHFLGWR